MQIEANLPSAAPRRDPSPRDVCSLAVAPAIAALFESPRPWMTEGAVAWLAARLAGTEVAVEFGGGSSSAFLAPRVARLHTVEANPSFAMVLLDWFQARPALLKKWRLHVVPSDWNTPKKLRSVWRDAGRLLDAADIAALEHDYLHAIAEPADLVLVDGAIRMRCVPRAVELCRRDAPAAIVVDNTESPAIAEVVARAIPSEFARTDFAAGPHDEIPPWQDGRWITSVFVRG